MAKGKPGLRVNIRQNEPIVFTAQAETTIVIWPDRRGTVRIRATKRLKFQRKVK